MLRPVSVISISFVFTILSAFSAEPPWVRPSKEAQAEQVAAEQAPAERGSAGRSRHIQVTPSELQLTGSFDRAQLVVSQCSLGGATDHRSEDLTTKALYRSSDENVVRINATGQATVAGNGKAEISVEWGGSRELVAVNVQGVSSDTNGADGVAKIDFLKDIRPILSKAGCAAGACHASQHGKGGFKLSVFGFDPSADYESITQNSRGRRVNIACPEASLLLEKATMQVTHGGGPRLELGSMEYDVLRKWIESGAPDSPKSDVSVKRLEVFPRQRVDSLGSEQQLRVVANYVDGSQRDVTGLAIYDALDTGILQVTASGYVMTKGNGQSAIMIRYDGQTAISTFVVPYSENASLTDWQNHNFIDAFASAKFSDLGIEPSPLCDDATFVRRAFLDAIGSLPDPATVVRFVESTDTNKRSRLIDQLLGMTGDPKQAIYNDLYAAFWTLRWSDLIRNNSASLGEQGMWAMHNWIRDSFRVNKPFDQFVREMVTAKGSIYSNGPANYFRVHGDTAALTEATSQLFMGVRLECAKCHQHPFESISQTDYYSMSAF
ncbi:MAG: DUF1549 domain-containing protein, partial [Pirellula sp.]